MRKKSVAIISITVCVCILLGLFVQGGGLSTLATALNVATTRVSDLQPKTNTSANLGNTDNPFTILEIVPSREESMIGYYFPGCEPIDMEKARYSQSAKQLIETTLGDIYEISETTVYAFYDEIPTAAENPYLSVYSDGLTDAQRTRTDVTYSDINMQYGQWRAAPADYFYSTLGMYIEVGEGKGSFAYNDATGVYTYVGQGLGTYNWTTSSYGDVTRYANGDVFMYTYVTYSHKDTFVSQVFNAVSDEFQTQVITLTPEELDHAGTIDQIDSVDLISIHGATGDYDSLSALYYGFNANGDTDSGTGGAAPTFWDAGKDLTYDEVIRIVDRMASSSPCALMLDKHAMFADTSARQEYNCNKLLYMTLMFSPSTFQSTFGDALEKYTGADGTGKVEYGSNRFWGSGSLFLTAPDGTDMTDQVRYYNIGSSGNDIFEKIFTYDGSAPAESLLSGGAIPKLSVAEQGINVEDATADAFVDENENATALTYLQAIEFTLQQSSYTPKIRVLELEGCDEYIYGSTGWESYYQSLFSWYSPTTDNAQGWLYDSDLIEVTTMPTWEFISSTGQYDYDEQDEYGNTVTLNTSSSDDLLAKYDVIIIGSKQNAGNGKNGYNKYTSGNENTNGGTNVDLGNLIYTSIGGSVGSGTPTKRSGNTNQAEIMNIHYSGNDITLKKVLELEDFLRAGKPIIVDSGLYKNGKVDTTKVDQNSKLYDLLTWDGDGSSNRFVSNNISTSRMKSLMTNNVCRLEFYAGGYPTEYDYTSTDTSVASGVIVNEIYQSKSSSGEAELIYHFYISGSATDTYNVFLNLDLNGDGVYSGSLKEKSEVDNMNAALGLTGDDMYQYDTTESSMGLTIYDRNMNELGETDPDNLKKSYALQANTEYYATRIIPSAQQGIIPWKLEVQSRSNSYLRSSAVDYTAVYNSENKKSITVLQMLLSGDMSKSTESLIKRDIWGTSYSMSAFTNQKIIVNSNDTYASFKSRMTLTADGEHLLPQTNDSLKNVFSANQNKVVSKFEEYLDPVQEFDVTIQFMYNDDWYKLFRTDKSKASQTDIDNWEDFLSNYDMVVFGFVDSNSYTSDPVFQEGIRDFVNQGKSMILSHDTVSGSDLLGMGSSAKAGYTTNAVWLRTLAGQRRAYYNKQADGTYVKSYTQTYANGTKINFVTNYAKNSLSSLLGDYSEALMGGTDTTTYKVNEYPDNDIYLSIFYKGYNSNVDRVAKGGTLGTSWPNSAKTTYVKLANNGQITTYPYKLDSVIQVLESHVQNFQLDLEYQEGGDVNVWFNLTDQYDDAVQTATNGKASSKSNYFSARDQDGRNNFYIYNKGNITYTGSGHGSSSGIMTDDEIKLFVNTMIAAYRQPESEPSVTIDSPDGTDGNGNSLLYIDYDGSTYDTYQNESGTTYGGGTKNSVDSRVETINGEKMVAIYFSIYDIGSSSLTNKQCYLSLDKGGTTLDSATAIQNEKLIVQEITKTADGETRQTLNAASNGTYLVDSGSGGVSYVLYFPYSDVNNLNSGSLDFTFRTYATYEKKNRNITTTEKSTTASVMLLPLFDLN